jgi:hypothetical protein
MSGRAQHRHVERGRRVIGPYGSTSGLQGPVMQPDGHRQQVITHCCVSSSIDREHVYPQHGGQSGVPAQPSAWWLTGFDRSVVRAAASMNRAERRRASRPAGCFSMVFSFVVSGLEPLRLRDRNATEERGNDTPGGEGCQRAACCMAAIRLDRLCLTGQADRRSVGQEIVSLGRTLTPIVLRVKD